MRVAAQGRHFFETVNWSWDLTVASGWVILIGSLFHNLLPYTASQDVVQRYVTTPDQKTAARGIWLNALISVPAQAVFFAIGTALIGALSSAVLVFAVRMTHPLNAYAYAPIGRTACVAIGWLASLVLPSARRSLEGLAIHTVKGVP